MRTIAVALISLLVISAAAAQQSAKAWGEPERTLVAGGSRGAFAGRKALELRPDVFDGGLISAGGGAGEIAVLNNKLNAVFVLKTLVNPDSPMTLVNVDNDDPATVACRNWIAQSASTC
jgi:predicted peptidase